MGFLGDFAKGAADYGVALIAHNKALKEKDAEREKDMADYEQKLKIQQALAEAADDRKIVRTEIGDGKDANGNPIKVVSRYNSKGQMIGSPTPASKDEVEEDERKHTKEQQDIELGKAKIDTEKAQGKYYTSHSALLDAQTKEVPNDKKYKSMENRQRDPWMSEYIKTANAAENLVTGGVPVDPSNPAAGSQALFLADPKNFDITTPDGFQKWQDANNTSTRGILDTLADIDADESIKTERARKQRIDELIREVISTHQGNINKYKDLPQTPSALGVKIKR